MLAVIGVIVGRSGLGLVGRRGGDPMVRFVPRGGLYAACRNAADRSGLPLCSGCDFKGYLNPCPVWYARMLGV